MRGKQKDKIRGKKRDKKRGKIRDKRRDKRRYVGNFARRSLKYQGVKRRRLRLVEEASLRAKAVIPQSARASRTEVLGRAGTWKRAAEESARLCQREGPACLPPSFAALNLASALNLTSEMCGCLEQVEWMTCVACWRAWYDLPSGYEFSHTEQGARSAPAPWFDLSTSVVAGAQKRCPVNQWRLKAAGSVEDARAYLEANYDPLECAAVMARLLCAERKRSVTICTECQKHVPENLVIPAPQGEMRHCDYVVDPVWCSEMHGRPAVTHERFEGACLPSSASGEVLPGSASGEVWWRVLGRSVEEFAPAVAALTDHEDCHPRRKGEPVTWVNKFSTGWTWGK